MALTVGTDTYVTLAEAVSYLARRLRTGPWDAATTTTRETALKHATLLLEALPWTGEKATSSQILAHPRGADTAVPQAIKDAQVELALWLLTFDAEAISHLARAGVVRHGIGPVSMELTRAGGFHALPPIVQSLLGDRVVLGAVLSR
jgi:hypothetical protein